MRTDIPPTIKPDVPTPCRALEIRNPAGETEKAIPVIAAATQKLPIVKRRVAGSLDDMSANIGPHSIFTKLFTERIIDNSCREISWLAANLTLRLSKLATRKKLRKSDA